MTSLVIPKVIGHRGAKAYAPENTLASIHAAADLSIEWVEVDVKLTKDSMAIIFHDEELERCTGTSGLVKDFTLQEIRELDAGSWYGESFIGEKIPTLDDNGFYLPESGVIGEYLEDTHPTPSLPASQANATPGPTAITQPTRTSRRPPCPPPSMTSPPRETNVSRVTE